jgi:hypothetical protein
MSSRPDPLPRQPGFRYSGLLAGLTVLVRGGGQLLAFLLYAVLATLEPLVRVVLCLLALGGLVTCGIYRFLLHDPHFPLWTLLLFSFSMCALAAVYSVVLRWLARA